MNAFRGENELEETLSTPTARDCECLSRLDGDIMVLGAGGKIGPSLARRVKRASDLAGRPRRILAVSRFGSGDETVELLEASGIDVRQADLLDRDQVAKLPDAPNILYLAGRKFGSSGRADLTWAINVLVSGYVAERFASSRIVVFSTGNVYPFVTPESGGSKETDSPDPTGEYAQSCVGRERVFEYFSREKGTPCLLFRLNYAVDLRYGVLVDIATRVKEGQPIPLAVGNFNVIWQGDMNSYAIRSLELCESPPRVLNVTGPEIVTVRFAGRYFAERFGKEPVFEGEESSTALLSNASTCHGLLGVPEVSLETLMDWVAEWVGKGGRLLNKPTHFEAKDGRY